MKAWALWAGDVSGYRNLPQVLTQAFLGRWARGLGKEGGVMAAYRGVQACSLLQTASAVRRIAHAASWRTKGRGLRVSQDVRVANKQLSGVCFAKS